MYVIRLKTKVLFHIIHCWQYKLNGFCLFLHVNYSGNALENRQDNGHNPNFLHIPISAGSLVAGTSDSTDAVIFSGSLVGEGSVRYWSHILVEI